MCLCIQFKDIQKIKDIPTNATKIEKPLAHGPRLRFARLCLKSFNNK